MLGSGLLCTNALEKPEYLGFDEHYRCCCKNEKPIGNPQWLYFENGATNLNYKHLPHKNQNHDCNKCRVGENTFQTTFLGR